MHEPTTAAGSTPADADSAAGARHAALAVLSRRRMLETLQAAGEPLDVAHLAAAVGLHVTMARFHLDLLERSDLVSRSAEHAGRPGRPRQLYTAVPSPDAREGHRQLAGVLAAALAGDAMNGSSRAEPSRPASSGPTPRFPPCAGCQTARPVPEWQACSGGSDSRPDSSLPSTEARSSSARAPSVTSPGLTPRWSARCTSGCCGGPLRRSGIPARQAQQAGLRPIVEPELCVADLPIPRQRQRP